MHLWHRQDELPSTRQERRLAGLELVNEMPREDEVIIGFSFAGFLLRNNRDIGTDRAGTPFVGVAVGNGRHELRRQAAILQSRVTLGGGAVAMHEFLLSFGLLKKGQRILSDFLDVFAEQCVWSVRVEGKFELAQSEL